MKLQAKMSQRLMMNPQLQQAIKLLQMSRLEMEQFIQQNLLENPVLEEVENISESTLDGEDFSDEHSQEQDFLDTIDPDYDYESYNTEYETSSKIKETDFNEQQNILETTLSKDITLSENLIKQISVGDFNALEKYILCYLANNLYENGYLCGSLAELLASSKEALDTVQSLYAKYTLNRELELSARWVFCSTEYQKKSKQEQSNFHCKVEAIPAKAMFVANTLLLEIQKLYPLGCGSRSLQECLSVQAKERFATHSLEYLMLSEHWHFFINKKYKMLAKKLGCSVENIEKSAKKIQTLTPFPGNVFITKEAETIIPDVYLIKQNGEYKIRLNNKFHKFHVNPYYKKIIEDYSKKKIYQSNIVSDKEVSQRYILEKVRAGEWLIKNIEQRQETIQKVSESILKKQQKFFQRGKEYLRPMVLKDIAQDIGMHESTVSRITNRKYICTPRGTFELKYFFSSGIEQASGEVVSSLSIKEYIRQIISRENLKKPVTDDYIVIELAKKKDIKLARRTIAKYREAMGILSSNKRRLR